MESPGDHLQVLRVTQVDGLADESIVTLQFFTTPEVKLIHYSYILGSWNY